MIRRSLFLAVVSLMCCPHVASGQDQGVPDTVVVAGDSLFTLLSQPVSVSVTNDNPIKSFFFGLVSTTVDGGFARLDSIAWVGRMADTLVLNLRISGPRDNDGVSPDTTVLNAFKAGVNKSPLPPGSGVIAQLWMTGVAEGMMVVDSGFLPPGGPFTMVPYIGDFSGTQFTPQFVSTSVVVVEGSGLTCGNIDASDDGLVNISDLTALIDFLFINFTVPPGIAAANVDGSADGLVNIADLTLLIDHLFINFPPLNCQ